MNNRLDTYVILDAKAVMHHCYHIGTDPDAVITDLGNTVNTAQFAFANFLERYMLPILEYARPYQILIAHDAGIEYRRIIEPTYKLKRTLAEKDPEEQAIKAEFFEMMKRFWANLGCTQARVQGVEADDIIAYFCEQLPGNKIVYTTDADLLQLVNSTTQVFLKCEPQDDGAHKGIPYKYTSISKSMLGDTSDQYIGVHGFGDAKWDMLVEAFGYDGIDELETCVKTKDYTVLEDALAETGNKALKILNDKREQWEVAYDVAILHPELCWKPKGKKLTHIDWYKRVPNATVMKQILHAMGCSHFYSEHFEDLMATEWAVTNVDIDEEFYESIREEFRNSDIVAFDYETHPSDMALLKTPKGKDNVDVKEALITGVSFNFGNNLQNTIYIPVAHKDSDNVPVSVIKKILDIAEEESQLTCQNMAFELAVTKTNLEYWLGKIYDTQLMSSYVDENESAGLKLMSKRLLNYDQQSYADTVTDPETGEMRTMDQLTVEEVISYGCDDSLVTAHLFILMRIIMNLEGSWKFFEENKTQSVHSLTDAYLKGCEIDWQALEVQHQKDLANIKVNMVRLRELLTEHCLKPNVPAAEAYIEEEKKYIRALAKEKIKDQLNKDGIPIEEWGTQVADAMSKALSDARSKAIDASQYTPYEETYEAPEFKPTKVQLNELLDTLGFDAPLEKLTRAAITDWLTEVNNFDADKSSGTDDYSSDQKRFIRLFGECAHQISKREGEAYDQFIKFCSSKSQKEGKVTSTGDELNTGSAPQMAHLLYCKLGLPVRLKTMAIKSKVRSRLGVEGSPQTDALAVETAMAEDTVDGDWKREAMDCIKDIKESKTRCSLYHDPYPLWKSMRDGRIHPQIRDCGTVTRRPTSTSPNILQVSKHQQKGVMRSIFLPYAEDELIVSIDFSQQELRIMASECEDPNLVACYMGDTPTDVHSKTASGIAHVSYEDYMVAYKDDDHEKHDEYSTIRKRPAKQTNFLLAYMGEANTLARRLVIPLEEGQEMMNSAYATYPGILPWQAKVCKFGYKHGYTQTAYGNRKHLGNDIRSDKKGLRKRMERQAVNATIQGCAADILSIVLTQCWQTNLWSDTGATLLGPVYDEVTSSVPVSKVVEYINRLVEIMSITPPNHVVPMEADVSLGPNWRDQIEIGIRPTEEQIEVAIGKSMEMKSEHLREEAA